MKADTASRILTLAGPVIGEGYICFRYDFTTVLISTALAAIALLAVNRLTRRSKGTHR